MKKLCFLLFCLFSLALAEANWGRNTGYQFLEVPVGVAAIGRGYTGAAYGGHFSRFYNPALYGQDSTAYMAVEFGGNGFRDTKEFAGEIFVPVKSYFFALELLNRQVDGIGITGDFPGDVLDEGIWQSSEFSLSAGVHRTDWFTWALSLGGAFEKFEGNITKAFLFNVGATAEILEDKLVAGLSVLNLGRTSSFLNTGDEKLGTGENLPTSARFGVSYRQTIKNVDVVLNSDVKYMHYYDTTEKILDNLKDRIYVPVGVEISPTEWFVFRMGKQINHSTDKFNFGGGVKTDLFDADFSFVIRDFDGQVEPYWKAGVTFNVGRLIGDSADTTDSSVVEIKDTMVIKADPMVETDVKESDVKESDVKKLDVKESDIKESDIKESDVKESDVKESDVKESDVKESDVKESDVKESDVKESDVKESDVKESDVKESDVKESETEVENLELEVIEEEMELELDLDE